MSSLLSRVKSLRHVKFQRHITFQYVSDLHLEFYDVLPPERLPLLINPVAPYLVLAGDIGHPNEIFKELMAYVSAHWKHVFYVAGNHEYYTLSDPAKWKYKKPVTMQEREAELEACVRPYKNVHMLNAKRPSYFLHEEGMAVVGATLWSHVPPHVELDAATRMNDYRQIPYRESDERGTIRSLWPTDTNAFHARDKAILREQIEAWGRKNIDVCVVTHYIPSFTMIHRDYIGKPLNECYASHCDDLFLPNVKGWIYGHTHTAAAGTFRGAVTGCNPRGYKMQWVEGWSSQQCMELKVRPLELADMSSRPPMQCRHCTENLDGGDVLEVLREKYPDVGEEELVRMAADYGWTRETPIRFSREIAVQTERGDPEFTICPACHGVNPCALV